MPLQLLLDEPHVAISYDHVNEWLYADWRGCQTMRTGQQGGRDMLHLLGQQRCAKVLNDNRHVTGTWSEAAEWVGKDWFPAMLAAGLRHFAWVYSPDMYSSLSTDLSLQFTSGSAVVVTFSDVALARAWLAQV